MIKYSASYLCNSKNKLPSKNPTNNIRKAEEVGEKDKDRPTTPLPHKHMHTHPHTQDMKMATETERKIEISPRKRNMCT